MKPVIINYTSPVCLSVEVTTGTLLPEISRSFGVIESIVSRPMGLVRSESKKNFFKGGNDKNDYN